jgi:hypothetical protein
MGGGKQFDGKAQGSKKIAPCASKLGTWPQIGANADKVFRLVSPGLSACE